VAAIVDPELTPTVLSGTEIDLSADAHITQTLTGNTTYTIGTKTPGKTVVFEATMDGTGGYAVAFTGVDILTGTFDALANVVNIVTLRCFDSSTVYANIAQVP